MTIVRTFTIAHTSRLTYGYDGNMTTHKLETICYDAKTRNFIYKTTTKALGPSDVLIRTTHSGLCTTDAHAKGKGCGLGHEGVGIVEKVGECVRNLSVGQRVGWGWLHSVGSRLDVQYNGLIVRRLTMR